jgi:hypothetical protein
MSLSATSGDDLISQLRLASARRRLTAFLEQIEDLQTSSFPHPDGEDALFDIKENFLVRLNGLNLPPGADPLVVDGVCTQTSLAIEKWTPVLGFILRSTNVRNPFELHFPLKRLVRTVIDPSAKLLMSSEWDFVPFTYPMTLDLLPNYVLVGGPAPESGNVLITPLAGHEIGHSAWRHYGFKADVETPLAVAINEVLEADPAATKALLDELERARFNRADLTQACLRQGLKQLEEIFCDLFGLYVFGLSYLFAFEYFLAPGGQGRNETYPSSLERIRFLLEAATALDLKVDEQLFLRWNDSSPDPGLNSGILDVTDKAVARVVLRVRERAFKLLTDKGVATPDDSAVARVLKAFRRQEPDADGASLPEIITAGWIYIRGAGGLATSEEQEQYRMLGELMLKSVEVSEFRRRVAGDA